MSIGLVAAVSFISGIALVMICISHEVGFKAGVKFTRARLRRTIPMRLAPYLNLLEENRKLALLDSIQYAFEEEIHP